MKVYIQQQPQDSFTGYNPTLSWEEIPPRKIEIEGSETDVNRFVMTLARLNNAEVRVRIGHPDGSANYWTP